MEDRQSEINRFWEKAGSLGMTHETRKRVTNPRQRRDEVLLSNDFHTIEKTTLGTTEKDGDTALVTLVHRPTGSTNDRDTRILAQYFEKKSTIDKIGVYSVMPFDVVHRIGPSVYYYPSGEMAALEMYSETYDVHQPKGQLLDHVCYNDDYERTSLATFDVHYRNVFKNMGFPEIVEYAPRISEYKSLVEDLKLENEVCTMRFDASDIREFYLSDKPLDYLDMLANDVRTDPDDKYKKRFIDSFVYGTDKQANNFANKIIKDEKDKQGIKKNTPTVTRIKKDGLEIERTTYASKQSDAQYIVDAYKGAIMRKAFKYHDEDHTDNFQKEIIYYPDGTINSISRELHGTSSYDCYGKICAYSKARNSFLAEWKDQKQCITMSIDSKGGYEKFWNMRHSGFDVNVLKMELDGKKIELCDGMELAPGQHEVKIILDTSHDLLMSPSLFKGCSKHDDLSINGIPAERFINPPKEIRQAIKKQEEARLKAMKNSGPKR